MLALAAHSLFIAIVITSCTMWAEMDNSGAEVKALLYLLGILAGKHHSVIFREDKTLQLDVFAVRQQHLRQLQLIHKLQKL